MSCPRVPMTSSVYQCLVLVSRSLVPYPSDFSCPGDFDTQKYTFFSDFPPPAHPNICQPPEDSLYLRRYSR